MKLGFDSRVMYLYHKATSNEAEKREKGFASQRTFSHSLIQKLTKTVVRDDESLPNVIFFYFYKF